MFSGLLKQSGCAAGEQTAVIPKGTPVTCGMCHKQK